MSDSFMPPPSALISNGIADLAKIGVAKQAVWEKILAVATKHGIITESTSRKVAATTLLSVAGAFVDWNLGKSDSMWAKVFKEVATDGASEVGSRLFGDQPPTADASERGLELIWTLQPEQRSALIQTYTALDAVQRKRLRAVLVQRTVAQMQTFAQMSDPERQGLMELISPTPGPSEWNAITDGIKNITGHLNRYAGRSVERR